MKVNDEIEQAFREGYEKGYKAADKGEFINGLKAIANHYGFTSQADMLCEEAGEFITARNKIRRGVFEAANNFKEELADILVVALQLRLLLGERNIDEIMRQKIQRQLDRIKSERQQAAIGFINEKGEYFNDKHNS